MCGIAGTASFETTIDKELVKRMTRILSHRGPDAEGFFFDKNAGLGHRRLSIIDLSKKAKQPLSNENETVFVACNGEIYNFLELRALLEKKGHRFKSNSDSETIVHAFEEWRENCFERLRGMFAIAIWDAEKKELFLARDRVGIKPLFYAFSNGTLLFGSEQKAILECREFTREVNLLKLKEFMRLDYYRGNETLFKGLFQAKPSHYIRFSKKGIEEKRYYSIPINERNESEEQLAKELRELLQESVQAHLQSDVPVGVFLSGGLDSSSATVLASKKYKNLHTYSVGFGEFAENELDYAKAVAEQCGTKHKEIIVEAPDLKLMKEIVWHLDDPMSDLATIPIYLMSEKAAKEVKVVLTGEGNDEMWAGYTQFKQIPKIYDQGKFFPAQLKDFFVKIAPLLPEGWLRNKAWFVSNIWKNPFYYETYRNFNIFEEKKLLSEKMLAEKESTEEQTSFLAGTALLNKLLLLFIKNKLANCFLVKIDRMTMAHGLEARVPWLDNKLIEFAFSTPTGLKVHDGKEKYLFRKAMQPMLLKKTFEKGKRGFGVPFTLWLNQNRKELLSVIDEKTIRERGLFSPTYSKKLLAKESFDELTAIKLWSMIMLELWQQQYFD